MNVSPSRGVRARLTVIALGLLLVRCDRIGPPRVDDVASTGPRGAMADEPALIFARDGRDVRTLTRGELAALGTETIDGEDPYYHRRKRFRAVAIERVLQRAFGGEGPPLVTQQFLLRARDGYTVPINGERLLEGGCFIALEDLDVAGWEPVGPQRANPGPFFMIWRDASQRSLEEHPRPWQLARIEIAAFEAAFPHTAPRGEPDGSLALEGYSRFRSECARCHAINREGGRVGPDLNVPQSIVEYRPEAQIRAYIRNPLAFRYGVMPAHPHLTEHDLDALIAYFRAMSVRKHDPDAPSRPDAAAP